MHWITLQIGITTTQLSEKVKTHKYEINRDVYTLQIII